jgi:hypothetical protein
MSLKAKSRWTFDPNALTAPYVLIVVGAIVSLFVFGVFVDHDTFTRWGGLAYTTAFLYGFLIYDSRHLLKSRRFWAMASSLFVLHVIAFVLLLAHVHEWRFPWFTVMLLEVPIFNAVRNRTCSVPTPE